MIDKVATVSTVRIRKVDTSAPMETGTAIKDYGETIREEDQRIVNLASQAVYKGTGDGKCDFGQVQSGNGKGYHGGKGGKDGGKNSWQKGSGKKNSREHEKRWQEKNQILLDMWKNRAHMQHGVRMWITKICMPWMKRTVNMQKYMTWKKTPWRT